MSNNNLQNAEVQLFSKNIDNNINSTKTHASVVSRSQAQISADNKQIVHILNKF